MGKHTPGPWAVSMRNDKMGSGPNRSSYEIVHNLEDGCQEIVVGKHTGIDCLELPDARLISAAPEMLEALKRLVNAAAWSEESSRFDGRISASARAGLAHVLQNAREVLAKAEGA